MKVVHDPKLTCPDCEEHNVDRITESAAYPNDTIFECMDCGCNDGDF